MTDTRVFVSNSKITALEQTFELLFQADRRPLFGATFAYEDVLVRVDLLIPEADGWRICEVKSTASQSQNQGLQTSAAATRTLGRSGTAPTMETCKMKAHLV